MTSPCYIVALSLWLDAANAHRDPEAQAWNRLAKVSEEAGEVIEAFMGVIGSNPRKGKTHTVADVLEELLDVAVSALGAYEHLTGNNGLSVEAMFEHAEGRARRAGLTTS